MFFDYGNIYNNMFAGFNPYMSYANPYASFNPFMNFNNPYAFYNPYMQQNYYPPIFNFGNNFSKSEGGGSVSKKGTNVNISNNKRLELIKNHLKKVEGGYAVVKGDNGGATKHGVTHFTYDSYRKRKHLPLRSVSEMTDDEFSEIIEYFWTKSGADKIKDPILAFYVFSTDWGSGIGKSKKFLAQSGEDPQKFEQIRRDFYNRIAVGTNAKFKKGWQNRVTKDHDFAYSLFGSNKNYNQLA